MARPEALILRKTIHGRRLLPITKAEAEELVEKGKAKLLKAGIYDSTKVAVEHKTRNLTTTPKRS